MFNLKSAFALFFCLCFLLSSLFAQEKIKGNTIEPTSPYISRVLEYCPAPGQFIDYHDFLRDSQSLSDLDYAQVLDIVSKRMVGSAQESLAMLGSWGGYITVSFDQGIANLKGQYDFAVYGNAYFKPGYEQGSPNGTGGSCEPGIIMVMKDVNKNGLADDQWYMIKGSEHDNTQTIHNYSLTYYRPSGDGQDIRWRNSMGDTGFLYRVAAHNQSSYYPEWLKGDSIVFKGERLPSNEEELSPNNWMLWAYDSGYSDNYPNNSDFSKMKIDWAIDSLGNSVYLDTINFIKVYTGVHDQGGWLGNVSTEFSGIENLHFSSPTSIEGDSFRLKDDDFKLEFWPNPCKNACQVKITTSRAGDYLLKTELKLYSPFRYSFKNLFFSNGLE